MTSVCAAALIWMALTRRCEALTSVVAEPKLVVPANAGTQRLSRGQRRTRRSARHANWQLLLWLFFRFQIAACKYTCCGGASAPASEGQRSGGQRPLFPQSGHPALIRALGFLPRSSRPLPAGPLPRASGHRAPVCRGRRCRGPSLPCSPWCSRAVRAHWPTRPKGFESRTGKAYNFGPISSVAPAWAPPPPCCASPSSPITPPSC